MRPFSRGLRSRSLALSVLLIVAFPGGKLAASPDGERSVARAVTSAGATAAPVRSAILDGDRDGDGLSDAFEGGWGLTSPDAADSDGDGLIDAGEDLDGDGLSGLAEQRYGTDPGSADSDGDGLIDPGEDSDGDGRADGPAQDRRPLPAHLRPTLEMAWWDRPGSYDDRCHNDAVDPELRVCSFAARGSDVTVALFGDSHALQWLPALVAAAEQEGWEVITLTKAACPPAQVEFGRKEIGAAASCRVWRQRALDRLAADPPDVLLLSGAGRAYKLLDGEGQRIPDDAALEAWQRGLAETLEVLPAGTQAVVLADTPLMARNPVSCLAASPGDLSACQTPRADALAEELDAAERAAAEESGRGFASLSDLVCPTDPCPVVMGDILMWRNADHITATYSAQLAPAMRDLVAGTLAGAGDPGTSAPASPVAGPSGQGWPAASSAPGGL